MTDFSQRLHETIAYAGLLQKDVALKAGIKKRALDMYLGSRKSMPPADVAARLADALGVSVEYLVTGKTSRQSYDLSDYLKFRGVISDLRVLPDEILRPITTMIKAAAEQEREKN
ncbi:MAG: helix-turn-helix domain-containing protein [Treponema sp.]|jgi:transcriptional regulator with XRE-family HTH domain|nr:helix-turn-helix domain-containing protein [Treponema sp.]